MNIPDWKLAQLLGAKVEHVTETRGALEVAFAKHSVVSDNVTVAALATVRVECPPFRPIHEYGTDEYFRAHYDVTGNPHLAARLGNDTPGDGVKYAGRGYIQLTGKSNYRKYGAQLGVDLVGEPDLALRPDIAAEIFALYFQQTGCVSAAQAQNWERVRKLVNGGVNGMELFLSIVTALLRESEIK